MKNHLKLKGAIIGFGFISSKGHMPAYLERMNVDDDVEILAICDITLARSKDVPAGIKFYTDINELFLEHLNELDFIDISTHAADHYKIAKLALEKGLHVLCEKPLTIKSFEVEDLIQTAIKFKCVLFPCHNYLHAPVVKAIREIVESGKIGKIRAITLNTFRNTHAIGTKDWKPDWRRNKSLSGGGIAMDHGSHSLYLTFEWLGGYPKTVTATSQNLSNNKYDTEDNFSACYEFENGIANIHLSWTAGVRKVIYTLQGDRGAITVDDDQMEIASLNHNDSDLSSHKASWAIEKYSINSHWMDSGHSSWFNSMFNQFIQAIATNDYANKEVMNAYYCIESISKAYESIENNSQKTKINNKSRAVKMVNVEATNEYEN